MAVGEVVRDDGDALVTEGLRRVVAERVVRLRGTGRAAGEPGVGLALREVFGRGRAGHDRRPGLADVVVDGDRLECGERPDDDVHLVALDQFLGLGACTRRVAAGVGDEQFDLAAGDGVVALLEEELNAFLHLLAASGERAGAHREEADADRIALRESSRGQDEGCGRGQGAQQQADQRRAHGKSFRCGKWQAGYTGFRPAAPFPRWPALRGC